MNFAESTRAGQTHGQKGRMPPRMREEQGDEWTGTNMLSFSGAFWSGMRGSRWGYGVICETLQRGLVPASCAHRRPSCPLMPNETLNIPNLEYLGRSERDARTSWCQESIRALSKIVSRCSARMGEGKMQGHHPSTEQVHQDQAGFMMLTRSAGFVRLRKGEVWLRNFTS